MPVSLRQPLLSGLLAAAIMAGGSAGVLAQTAGRPFSADPDAAMKKLDDQTTGQTRAPTGEQPAHTPEDGEAATGSEDAAPEVDETALRYFAQRGDTRRLEAEIARLRSLYPNWTPPADPLAVPDQPDEWLSEAWRLYSEGNFAQLRSMIAERRKSEPDWTPPVDLMDRLALAEGRERLVNASDLKQYETVIRIASANSSLLTCNEIDLLWRVAEAFAMTERPGRAKDAYTYILNTCTDPGERFATMQKALALLDEQATEDLLQLAEETGNAESTYDPIRDEIARRALAEAIHDPQAIVAPEDIARVEALFESEGEASDALLLGWYYYGTRQTAEAQEWFSRARAIEDTADASQGLALTQIELEDYRAAEATAYPWRESSDEARAVYLAAVTNLLAANPPILIGEDILQRIVPVVAEARHVDAAQQFGWYARALNQFSTARQWFETAQAWNPEDEPSAYGLALTLAQLGADAEVADLQARWAERSERIANLGEENPDEDKASGETAGSEARDEGDAVTAYAERERAEAPPKPAIAAIARQSGAPAAVLSGGSGFSGSCSSYVEPSTLSPGAALSRGWCLMEANRPSEAADAFGEALVRGSEAMRSDASYGQSLAYLRLGLTDQAALAAAKAPQSVTRGAELQSAILADRAVSAFDKKQYVETLLYLNRRADIAAERLDLMVLRGYAYLNLNREYDAQRIFEAAAAAGNRDALKGLGVIRQRRR